MAEESSLIRKEEVANFDKSIQMAKNDLESQGLSAFVQAIVPLGAGHFQLAVLPVEQSVWNAYGELGFVPFGQDDPLLSSQAELVQMAQRHSISKDARIYLQLTEIIFRYQMTFYRENKTPELREWFSTCQTDLLRARSALDISSMCPQSRAVWEELLTELKVKPIDYTKV